MAKKKSKGKNKKQQQVSMSPERFMREKVRTLPIGKCYVTPGWKETGIAQVIVTRVRPSRNIVAGVFLVDLFCLGVKDVFYKVSLADYEFEQMLSSISDNLDLEEISYDEAHNLIYGAIAFAKEAGIEPARMFNIGGFILEEDTDDIPLIEYDFGKDGKHHLVAEANSPEARNILILRKRLGDAFTFEIEEDDLGHLSVEDLKQAMDGWAESMAESSRYPMEKYSYDYPAYPATLSVKHQFIADELMSPDNAPGLPVEVIERILALPNDEATQDISNIVYYVIGQTYKAFNDDTIDIPYNGAILHSVMLLTQLRNEKGLDALLEIMRQDDDFIDYHFGDIMPEVMHQALYTCGKDNIPALEKYLYTPGYNTYFREQVPETYAMIAFNHPGRREEVIELFRRLLVSMVSRLPEQNACDGTFAALTLCYLIEMEATELIPEIKALFATGCVDRSVTGDCDTVIHDIAEGSKFRNVNRYKIPDIYKETARLRQWWANAQ